MKTDLQTDMETDTDLDGATALAELGVSEDLLSDDDRRALDETGWLRVPGVIDPEWLEQLRSRLAELLASEGDLAGHEVGLVTDADLLAALVGKGECFERVVRHPTILSAAAHVLDGDLKVNSLNYRAAGPGHGAQHLHSDCGLPRVDLPGAGYAVCNSMWLLDDFTADNGSTRAVPGSHRAGRLPAEVMDDRFADHPEQVRLTGRAGDVVVFNAHVWHSGTRNDTQSQRRGMTLSFCRRDAAQQTDQRAHVPAEVVARLTPAQRWLLDV